MTQSTADGKLQAVAISHHTEAVSRRLARIWAVAALGVFLVLGLTIGLPEGPDLEAWERQAQLATLAVLALATGLAWRWEGWGGSIMLVAASSLGVFAALQHQPAVAFLPALVFAIPAVGFLVAWQRTKTFASVVVMAATVAMVLLSGAMVAQAMYDHGFGATHPNSIAPGIPDTSVHWIWAGGVTTSSATVVARVDANHPVLVLADQAGASTSHNGEVSNGVWRFEMDDLRPNTQYEYRIDVGATSSDTYGGSFRTHERRPHSITIAVGSCSRLGSNGSVYDAIDSTNADLFIIPGDFFYADHVKDQGQLADAYETTLTQVAQASLYSSMPIAYVWDDHDYGGNNSDSSSPTRRFALDTYRTYVPHYQLPDPGAIYQSFTIGQIHFVMLDTRSQRTSDTLLGPEQLAWLEGEIRKSSDLTVIVSSVPWIAEATAGADDWGGFPQERQQIADVIGSSGASVLMVAGDAHMVAIDDGTNTDYSTAVTGGFPLLHAGALDRPGSVKGGPYSEGAFPGGGQFGLITIAELGSSQLEVTLSGRTWDNTTIVEYSFTVETP